MTESGEVRRCGKRPYSPGAGFLLSDLESACHPREHGAPPGRTGVTCALCGLQQGDSGGPLVCSRGKVAGILSFSSKACTDIFKPPVATAVAPYVSWIRKVIRH